MTFFFLRGQSSYKLRWKLRIYSNNKTQLDAWHKIGEGPKSYNETVWLIADVVDVKFIAMSSIHLASLFTANFLGRKMCFIHKHAEICEMRQLKRYVLVYFNQQKLSSTNFGLTNSHQISQTSSHIVLVSQFLLSNTTRPSRPPPAAN